MKSKKLIRILLILLVLVVNIGCDQVSKSIVRKDLDPNEHIDFLSGHVNIARVENTGAFLSMGDSMNKFSKVVFLNLFPLLVVVLGLVYIIFKPGINRVTLLGILLVIGGGAGNLYDRIAKGSVTDFLHINFVIFQTGIFNVADMSISTGVVIILIKGLMEKKKDEPKESVA